jgi:hypothetical protein
MFFISFKPVPKHDAQDAVKHMLLYNQTMTRLVGPHWNTWKNHVCTHIIQDLINHGMHMDRLSAYAFENEYGVIKNLLRTGYKTPQQLV